MGFFSNIATAATQAASNVANAAASTVTGAVNTVSGAVTGAVDTAQELASEGIDTAVSVGSGAADDLGSAIGDTFQASPISDYYDTVSGAVGYTSAQSAAILAAAEAQVASALDTFDDIGVDDVVDVFEDTAGDVIDVFDDVGQATWDAGSFIVDETSDLVSGAVDDLTGLAPSVNIDLAIPGAIVGAAAGLFFANRAQLPAAQQAIAAVAAGGLAYWSAATTTEFLSTVPVLGRLFK